MANEEHMETVKRSLRRTLNIAVADGLITGDEALACIMVVVSTMISQVKSPTARIAFVDAVVASLPATVQLLCGEITQERFHEITTKFHSGE